MVLVKECAFHQLSTIKRLFRLQNHLPRICLNCYLPVPNGKFNLTREIPSTARPKNQVIEDVFDDDSLASVSSEEPETLVPNLASE